MLLVFSNLSYAGGEHVEKKKFDISEMIFSHISDSHDFHLWGDLAIPLPCIFYDAENGLSVFMSSKFDHGSQDIKGYHYDHGQVSRKDGLSFWDFSITKNVFMMLLVCTLLFLLFKTIASRYVKNKGKAPSGIQNFFEPIILFVRDDIAKDNIGEKYYMKFYPYIAAVFFFILGLNLFGLIPFFPGSANVTGNIAVTAVLAIFTAIITNVNGKKDYWQHMLWMPGVPTFVKPILTLIESLGAFLIKPGSLMIRLFANITAGHIIILSLVCILFIFGRMGGAIAGYGSSIVVVPFMIFMNMLELFVAALQAFIFTILTAVFIGQALEDHDHDHDHEEAH